MKHLPAAVRDLAQFEQVLARRGIGLEWMK